MKARSMQKIFVNKAVIHQASVDSAVFKVVVFTDQNTRVLLMLFAFTDRTMEMQPLPSLTQDIAQDSEQKSSTEGGTEHQLHPAATRANPDVDLKDPSKYCGLCAASFNNPQMAMQHYNGRKHQRNQARLEMLNELGDDVQKGNAGGTRRSPLPKGRVSIFTINIIIMQLISSIF